MNLDRCIIVHEAGHLIVGLEIGMLEDVIIFAGLKPGEGAASFTRSDDADKWVLRSLGGILAEIQINAESIPPHLLRGYRHSVILDRTHPLFEEFRDRRDEFLPTAWKDMEIARGYAEELSKKSGKTALEHLKDAEQRVREIIQHRELALRGVVDDIMNWASEPDGNREVGYSASRALGIIEKTSL